MGKKSRDKGKRGELQARDAIREHWFAPACERTAQRSGETGVADLKGAFASGEDHVEVKLYRRIGAMRFMEQAVADSEPGRLPMVVMREDNGEWMLMLRLSDATRLGVELDRNRATFRAQFSEGESE